MTLVTGTVQDLGYDGMDGTLWARPARFRSDGSVVYAPERKPYKVVDGVVSADLAPGPAVLELQVGSHARGTFEVVIPEEDTTLADLLDTVFPWEPEQVSLFVAERLAAEAAAGAAAASALQTGQDRTAVALDRAAVEDTRDLLDAAYDQSQAGMTLPPRLMESALNATYAPSGTAAGLLTGWQGVDLMHLWHHWDTFLDASPLGAAATKSQIGTAPDGTGGTVPIWAYTAGATAAPHLLMMSGVHGHEVLPPGAAFRWMEAFATSSDPVFVELRRRIKVTWVPLVNPVNYRTAPGGGSARENANGVDLNRNYDQDWDLERSLSKGAAPFSETEAQAIRDLIDEQNISFVLDLHTQGDRAFGDVAITSPGPHIGADPAVSVGARTRLAAMLAGTPHRVSEYDLSRRTMSSGTNWAGRYLRWTKKRDAAGAILMEVYNDLGGSTPWALTDTGAHLMCNAIHAVVTEWLAVWDRPSPPLWSDLYAERSSGTSTNDTIPIGEGGLALTANSEAIWFNSNRNYIGVPVVGPGLYTLHYEVTFFGSVETPATMLTYGALAPMPLSGDLPPDVGTLAPFVFVPGATMGKAQGGASFKVSEPGRSSLLMAQVFARFSTGENPPVRLSRRPAVRAWVTYSPESTLYPPSSGYVR